MSFGSLGFNAAYYNRLPIYLPYLHPKPLRLEILKLKVEPLVYDFFFVPMSFVFIGKKKSRPLPLTLNFHKT